MKIVGKRLTCIRNLLLCLLSAALLCACQSKALNPMQSGASSGGQAASASVTAESTAQSAAASESAIPPETGSAPASGNAPQTAPPSGSVPESLPAILPESGATPPPQAYIRDFYYQLYDPAYAGTQETTQQNSKDGREGYLETTKAQLFRLMDANILPISFIEQLLPYLERDTVNYTLHTDHELYQCLGCNFGMGTAPPFYVTTFYTLENEIVYSLDMSLPFYYSVEPYQRDAMGRNLIAYLGLDVYDDWEQVDVSGEGDPMALDHTAYMSLFQSQKCGLSVSVVWHDEEGDGTITCGYNIGFI